MDKARFRFYADLNRFLPAFWRQRAFLYPFTAPRSVKDMIEAAGVPHTEIALILVNGQPVSFAYHVQDGDRVSIYPSFRSIDISPRLVRADPPPVSWPIFTWGASSPTFECSASTRSTLTTTGTKNSPASLVRKIAFS
jgi:hypothetical protein